VSCRVGFQARSYGNDGVGSVMRLMPSERQSVGAKRTRRLGIARAATRSSPPANAKRVTDSTSTSVDRLRSADQRRRRVVQKNDRGGNTIRGEPSLNDELLDEPFVLRCNFASGRRPGHSPSVESARRRDGSAAHDPASRAAPRTKRTLGNFVVVSRASDGDRPRRPLQPNGLRPFARLAECPAAAAGLDGKRTE